MGDAAQVLGRAAVMLDELDVAAGTDDPATVYGAVVEVARQHLDCVRAATLTTFDGRRITTAATAGEQGGDDQADGNHVPALSLELAGGEATRSAVTLNLYTAGSDALAPETVQLAMLLAGHARILLVAAGHSVRAANLDRSRVTGQQIGAAVGLLMAVKRISHDEARDLLRTTSQRANRRVSDLAAEVVATGMLPGLKKKIGPRRGDS